MKKIVISFLVLVPLSALLDRTFVLWQRGLDTKIDQAFSVITHLGKSEWILIPLGLYCGYYHFKHKIVAYKSLFVLLSVAISGVLIQPFKVMIGRARPSKFEQLGAFHFKPFAFEPAYYSFPSGHSTTALALSMSLALLFPRYRIILLTTGFFIAFTRVIVGAHYLSDIVAGSIIGIGVAYWLFQHKLFNKTFLR